MAKITTANYNDFVRNAEIMWREGYQRVPMVAKALYDVIMNDQSNTEHGSMDGFTFARRKAEGDNYYKQSPEQNYTKTMIKYRIGLEAEITWEMRKYDKYREMSKALRGLGEATRQRIELDLTHRFTFGVDASYVDMDGTTVATTVADGFQLFYTAHTVPGSSTTFRNRIANNPSFSKGGLEAADKLFATQMIDAAGNKVTVTPDTIITTDDPNLVNAVSELLRSMGAPTGAHGGVENVYRAKYAHIVLPYLATDNLGAYNSAKATYWMLASVAHTDAVLEVSEMPHVISPAPGSNSEDFENDDWKFKSSAAYGIEIIDPRWIVMSDGLGTA